MKAEKCLESRADAQGISLLALIMHEIRNIVHLLIF
jgi:hypothetical protein